MVLNSIVKSMRTRRLKGRENCTGKWHLHNIWNLIWRMNIIMMYQSVDNKNNQQDVRNVLLEMQIYLMFCKEAYIVHKVTRTNSKDLAQIISCIKTRLTTTRKPLAHK